MAERGNGLAGGAAWQTLAQFAPLVINLALTPMVIQGLGFVAYGLWLIASALAAFMSHFDGGIGRTAQNFFARYTGTDDRIATTRLLVTMAVALTLLSTLLLGPLVLLAPAIVEFFHAPEEHADGMRFLLQMLVLLVAVGLIRNLFASVLMARSRFSITSGTLVIAYAVYAAGMVYVIHNDLGLHGMAWVFLGQQVVSTVLVLPPALRYLDRRGIAFSGRSEVINFFRIAWRVQISGLLTMVSFQGLILIVGRLAHGQVPQFGPGATFSYQVRQLFMNAVAPMETRLGFHVGQSGGDSSLDSFVRMQRVWTTITTGAIAVGAPAAYFGVNHWLPLPGDLAGVVAASLIVAHLFALLPQVLLQWMLVLQEPSPEIWSSIIASSLLLVGSLVGVPLVGAIAVPISAIVANALALLYLEHRARGLTPRTPGPLGEVPILPAMVAGGLSTLLTALMSRVIDAHQPPFSALGLLLCAVAALPALYVFLVMSMERTLDRPVGFDLGLLDWLQPPGRHAAPRQPRRGRLGRHSARHRSVPAPHPQSGTSSSWRTESPSGRTSL